MRKCKVSRTSCRTKVMESYKSKCLICEESYPQNGLAFFKFPKEKSRLKMWITEISPLLDILKVTPESVKKNGRICARHFKEKDFVNLKRNLLVKNACPNFDNHSHEEDIFQCGRCKTKFQNLSHFMTHKRTYCDVTKNKASKDILEKNAFVQENTIPNVENTILINFENKLTETCQEDENNPEKLVKIASENKQSEKEIVSFVVNDNELLIGNAADFSTLPGQVILTSKNQLECGRPVILNNISSEVVEGDGPVMLDNISSEVSVSLPSSVPVSLPLSVPVPLQLSVPVPVPVALPVGSLILTTGTTNNTDGGEIVFTYPIQNGIVNNGMVLASEVPAEKPVNQVFLTTETSSQSEENEVTSASLNFGEVNNTVDVAQVELNGLNSFDVVSEEFAEKSENRVLKSSEDREIQNLDKTEYSRSKTKVPCTYCGKLFGRHFNLQQHERIHTGERPFQCIVCGRAFNQKSNVRKHMVRHKVWPQRMQTLKIKSDQTSSQGCLDQMSYSCHYCSSSFTSYLLLKKHLVVHSNFKVYRCIQKDCSQTFSDLDEFLSHSKTHSSAEFQCHICLKVFTSLEDLGDHQYDHDTTGKDKKDAKLKVKCEVCHAQFKTAESLKNHLAVDKHKYECVQCDSVFNSERFLRRHLSIHVDPKSNFKCQKCKKTFRTKKYLQNHSYVHLKEKPFNCAHCDKQFGSKYRLQRHLAIHLNQTLECPFKTYLGCDKIFYRSDKLRNHVTTHSQCRLHSCQVCTKMYPSLSKLKDHLKKEHKSGKSLHALKCINCSQTFRKQRQLMQHHCTVGERKFKSRVRNSVSKRPADKVNSLETVSNIEIIMVPFASEYKSSSNREDST